VAPPSARRHNINHCRKLSTNRRRRLPSNEPLSTRQSPWKLTGRRPSSRRRLPAHLLNPITSRRPGRQHRSNDDRAASVDSVVTQRQSKRQSIALVFDSPESRRSRRTAGRDTSTFEIPGSSLLVVGVRSAKTRHPSTSAYRRPDRANAGRPHATTAPSASIPKTFPSDQCLEANLVALRGLALP
jgi:hypothetical protein